MPRCLRARKQTTLLSVRFFFKGNLVLREFTLAGGQRDRAEGDSAAREGHD